MGGWKKEGWADGWKVDGWKVGGWMSLRVDVKTYGEYCAGIGEARILVLDLHFSCFPGVFGFSLATFASNLVQAPKPFRLL